MSHTIALAMQDHPGVLHRTVSLLRRRGYNIESLAVGRSETPGVSRMTLVVDAEHVEQVTSQLDRLVEVLAVADVTREPTTERETALLKLDAPAARVAEIMSVVAASRARVAELGPATMVVEVTDTPDAVERFIDRVREFGIRELARTGRIVLAHGAATAARAAQPHPPHSIAQADGVV